MHTVNGVVEAGKKHGTLIGYPTANIPLGDTVLSGIFAGRVLLDGASYDAALYADPSRGLLEAHLLDFNGDLYGKTITIEIVEKIREKMKFTDDEEARAVIADDIARVREYGAKHQ